VGEETMLTSLPQAAMVYFDGGAKSRHPEANFVREPISPALGQRGGVEFPFQQLASFPLVRGGIKIEVIADVWPMIQRLHHQDPASGVLQFSADDIQKFDGIRDAQILCVQSFIRPACQVGSTGFQGRGYEGSDRSHDYMVRVGKLAKSYTAAIVGCRQPLNRSVTFSGQHQLREQMQVFA
jgi:hypothetical protein